MITGDAFFVVNNGQENFFTRDGSFYVDAVGNLAMTSNGYNVMGWQVDPETMTIRQDTVTPLRIMSPENMVNPPEATTLGYMSGILDKNDTNVTSTSGKNVNLQFYDSLGYSYTARLNLKSTDDEGVYAIQLSSILDQNNEAIELPPGKSFQSLLNDGSLNTVNREGNVRLKKGYEVDGTDIKDGAGQVVGTLDTTKLGITIDKTNATVAITATDDEAVLEARQQLADAYGVESFEELNKRFIAGQTDPNDPDTAYNYSLLYLLTANDTNVKTNTGYDIADLTNVGDITYNREQIQGSIISYDPTTGVFSGVDGQPNVMTFDLNLSSIPTPVNAAEGASRFENITVDLSTTTMYNNNGSSTLGATSGNAQGLGTGRKIGEMIGVSIQTDGMIYATYDNGQTQLLGQIAVAEFANASGLEKQGDNLYSATLNSGEFDGIGVNITANGGYMNTGVLEMSNVDLLAEFTEMITTQRGFQANSRIITVSDTMLEELVNLKR